MLFLVLQVVLEAEVTNSGALALYGNLGFIRSKRLHSYYLNGVDAFRLKLLFPQAFFEDPSLDASDHATETFQTELENGQESLSPSRQQDGQGYHTRTINNIAEGIL